MKKLYFQLVIGALFSFKITYGQPVIEKITPPTTGTAQYFGGLNSIVLDKSTLIVSDFGWKNLDVTDSSVGAVFVYRKIEEQWKLEQTLSSGTNGSFGKKISYKNNVLVVSAPFENDTVKDAGRVYVYKRDNETSLFKLISKLSPVPEPGYSDVNFGGTSVATNGTYIVTNGSHFYYTYFYKIEADSVRLIKKLLIPASAPSARFWNVTQFFLTDNNNAILADGNFLLYNIQGDSIRFKEEFYNYYRYSYGNITVDGNTIAAQVYGSFPGAYETNDIIHVEEDGTTTVEQVEGLPFSYHPYTTKGGTIAFKERQWLFNTFTKGDAALSTQIVTYKYVDGKYYPAGTIDNPSKRQNNRDSFGASLSFDKGVVAIGDKDEITVGTSGNLKGAVWFVSVTSPFVIDTLGSKIAKNPLRNAYDNFAQSVALGSKYAVVGALENDIADSSGGGFLYRKDDGNWKYVRKFYKGYYNVPFDRAHFGFSADFSNNTVAIGSPKAYLYNSPINTGVVDVFEESQAGGLEAGASYTVYPPENAFFDEKLPVEEEFGYDVALDSIHLIVSAPKREGTGAVYYFKKRNNKWEYKQKISPAGLSLNSNFGTALDVKNNFLMVGSPNEPNGGAVYVYELVDSTFVLKLKLFAEEEGLGFGKSVSITDGFAALGFAKGNGARILKLTKDNWFHLSTLRPFSDTSAITVAIEKGNLLLSANNTAGEATVVRYTLLGGGWVKTGEAKLGTATEEVVKVSIAGDEALIGYQSSLNPDKSYAWFTPLNNIGGNIVTASVPSINSKQIILSPNPLMANGSLKINLQDANLLEVYSINGSLIGSYPIKNGIATMDNLSKGLYTVKISHPNTIYTEKLFVE